MQHHAADHLHIEMPHAECALGALAHDGEDLLKHRIELGSRGELAADRLHAGPQRLVIHASEAGFQRIDARHPRLMAFQGAVIRRTENGTYQAGKHNVTYSPTPYA